MYKSSAMSRQKAIAEAENNRDRLTSFLELNKPRKYSKKELSVALDMSMTAIAIALKDQSKISVSGDNPLKYSWQGVAIAKSESKRMNLGDRYYSAPQPKEQINLNPLCPECNSKSHKKGKDESGNQRYVCAFCGVKFRDSTSIKVSAPIDSITQTGIVIDDPDDRFLSICRHKTFYAVRGFRKGVISEAIAKKIAKTAFPDASVLPSTRSLIQNGRLLRAKVFRGAMSVGDASITQAIAHLISHIAFPDGED